MAVRCETMGSRVIQRIARGVRWWVPALLVAGASCSSDPPESTPSASSSVSGTQRTVSLVPSLAEVVIAIGAADHLVARTDHDTHPVLRDRPSIGGGLDPNLEALVGLSVDVVLIAAGRDTPALEERLAALGIRGVSFDMQSIADLHASIATLGELFGRKSQADSLSGHVSEALAAVRADVAGRDPVPVFYVVWPDPPMTVGPGAFIDEVIEIAGGRNVFADSPIEWPTVGFESIVERAPEVVLWPQGEITIDNIERLRDTPGWRDVRAVREGRVELVDANLFNRPGPNVVEAARTLARILHPDVR